MCTCYLYFSGLIVKMYISSAVYFYATYLALRLMLTLGTCLVHISRDGMILCNIFNQVIVLVTNHLIFGKQTKYNLNLKIALLLLPTKTRTYGCLVITNTLIEGKNNLENWNGFLISSKLWHTSRYTHVYTFNMQCDQRNNHRHIN